MVVQNTHYTRASLFHRRRESDDTSQEMDMEDPGDVLDEAGKEWPDFELPGVARQREFYQCCCGVVQGDYPMERGVAVEVCGVSVCVCVCVCVCVYEREFVS